MRKIILSLVILSLLLIGCETNEKETILVGAAASLTDPLEEIGDLYSSEHPNVEVIFTYGGSGTLSLQIEQGASLDLFLSASPKYTNHLLSLGLVDETAITDLLKNELVIVTHKDNPLEHLTFEELLQNDTLTIAMGDPSFVPAGSYALEVLGYDYPLDNGRVNLGSDVRQVLTWVEQNVVDIGIVYLSDAQSSDQVKILSYANTNTHTPIIYPLALLSNDETIVHFYNYLQSESSSKLFEKYGFKRSQ